jgi:hypothetical protein
LGVPSAPSRSTVDVPLPALPRPSGATSVKPPVDGVDPVERPVDGPVSGPVGGLVGKGRTALPDAPVPSRMLR